MAYTITTPQLGWVQIANTDSGILPPVATSSGSTTYIPTPPLVPGMIVEATDPTYGTGEFILLAGVASTAIGSLVTYNTTSYTGIAPCPDGLYLVVKIIPFRSQIGKSQFASTGML